MSFGGSSGLRRGLVGLCLALALAGCEVELLSGLSESEANEIVALLLDAGVPAEKRKEKGDSVTVLVEEDHFSQAVRLLQAQGLPRQSFDNLADVFAGDGIVSSPMEERARLTHALGQELSQTISSIDGVLAARVHVVLPTGERSAGDAMPSSASVFIRHEESADLSLFVPQIKTLVANAVAGLSYEKVSVALFPAAPTPPATAAAPAGAGGALVAPTVSTMTVALGVGLLGGGLWLMLRRRLAGLLRAVRAALAGSDGRQVASAAPQVTHAQADGPGEPSADAAGSDAAPPGATARDGCVA